VVVVAVGGIAEAGMVTSFLNLIVSIAIIKIMVVVGVVLLGIQERIEIIGIGRRWLSKQMIRR